MKGEYGEETSACLLSTPEGRRAETASPVSDKSTFFHLSLIRYPVHALQYAFVS